MNPALGRLAYYFLAVAVLLSGCLAPGCGYRFRATGEPLGIKIESLAIPLITSASSMIGFEADFTKIIREEFMSHGRVPIVPVGRAQGVLSGRVYEIETDALTYDYQEQTVQGHFTTHEVTKSRRLRVRLDMKLTDTSQGKVIWRDRSMEEKARFLVGPDPLSNRFQQRQALEKIARRLAKRIYLKTMERF
jgi:hypothetical protein